MENVYFEKFINYRIERLISDNMPCSKLIKILHNLSLFHIKLNDGIKRRTVTRINKRNIALTCAAS